MPTKTPSKPARSLSSSDLESVTSAMVRQVQNLRAEPRLFPGGITKFSLTVELTNVGRVQLEVSGPSPPSNPTYEQVLRGDLWSPVRFTAIESLLPPPIPTRVDNAPTAGTSADQVKLNGGSTIEGAAKVFASQCVGGDMQSNNCAHYLSNAFILAGFDELSKPEDCVTSGGRCATSAKRPIRARDMWCWFQKKAREGAGQSAGRVQPNTGIWALFQLDESSYWGGHVVILDSGAWKYYGTGWYDDWDQYSYKW